MSADIEKMAVFDDRIVQSRPRYAVEKGALSVTNSPFNAIAANTSQHTYNVLVPSENVFIDRAVDWTSTCFLAIDVVVPGGLTEASAQTPFALGGSLESGVLSLCPFPLQSLTTTMTATINDTTVTINSADVLPQVLRMTDYSKNRLVRTCPTMLDKYQSNLVGAYNNPINGAMFNGFSPWDVPNGSFPGLVWTDAFGNPLSSLTQATPGAIPGAPAGSPFVFSSAKPYPFINGATTMVAGTYKLYCSFTSTEKLVLSPFVFNDVHEWDTGLFGCQNIQLVMNLGSAGRVLRGTPASVTMDSGDPTNIGVAGVSYNTGASAGQQAFTNSRVNIQFLTPSLDVPLPPKSVVPYMEFPRYISNGLQTLAPGATATFSSQTITLPQIPDLIIIYAKPVGGYVQPASGYTSASAGSPDITQCDWMFPISKVSVNFDNFAGLLSAHTQQQLYKMSVHNGLEQDWAQWSGKSNGVPWRSAVDGVTQYTPVSTVGGMLVLKPGRDIVLQAGQAPSLVGNFVLQFNIDLTNTSQFAQNPQLYVITANSGFFETIKGSSRVVKGVLTEQDIISAPVAPGGTSGALRRAVGAGILGSLGNALSGVKGMFSSLTSPAFAPSAKKASEVCPSPMKGRGKSNDSLSSRLM